MSEITASLPGQIGRFALNARFSIPATGITGLFGASGSGKSSVLRCLAGLIRLPQGRVMCAGVTWQDGAVFTPPSQRGVGLVFQDGALFPHLDVRGNLAYAEKRAPGKRELGGRISFDSVVDMLALAPLLGRRTTHLSGGERQRVAIARALLAQPVLLLLDEPVSALDRAASAEILSALSILAADLTLPMLYVSHDLSEIARIADQMVLLDQGRVIAAGLCADLLADLSLPLAASPHALSVLRSQAQRHDEAAQITTLAVDGQEWQIPAISAPSRGGCRLRVMASDVGLARTAPQGTTILNMPRARIINAAPLPDSGQMNVLVRLGEDGRGQSLLARITRKSWESLGFQPGEQVVLLIKGVGLAEPD